MRIRSFSRATAIAAVGLLLAGAGAVPAVGAVRAPGWRIVAVLRHCGNDSLSSVVAAGPRDAWALGKPPWGGGPGCGADVEHWNGAGWRRVPVPRDAYASSALTATSASDAWIFPARMAHIGPSFYDYNYALHWNGKAWHASKFPGKLMVADAAALGPDDVWAFGGIRPRANPASVVPVTARYNGRAWHRVRLPVAPLAVSVAGRDLWVIGPTVATAARVASRQHIIAMRWNGRSWRRLAVPKIAVPAGQSYFDSVSIAATGPRDIWWYYAVSNQDNYASRTGLLHWNGKAWHAIPVSSAIWNVDAMTQDGHGGIWLAGDTPLGFTQYLYHYNRGRWSRQRPPSPRGYDGMLFGMGWSPGTTSIWADGEGDANKTVGFIAKYGH